MLHSCLFPSLLRPIGVLLLLCTAAGSHAQVQDNRVTRRVVMDRDTLALDSLSIVPGSFSLW
ncbi:MAG: hypothetical protein ABIY71_03855, partial [Flavobacteriales bacterium]